MDRPSQPGDQPHQPPEPTPPPHPTPTPGVDQMQPGDPPGDAAQGVDEKAVEVGHTGKGGAFGG